MRILLMTVLLSLGALACRDVHPVAAVTSISGYELHGVFTSSGGTPLPNVKVILSYNYIVVANSPVDTIPVIVHDPTKIVDVAVYSLSGRFIKQLLLGTQPTGILPRLSWDGTDTNHVRVPSALYRIRYKIGGQLVKISSTLVDGDSVTVTDASGKFKITNENLPIDSIIDLYTADNIYQYTIQVTPDIDLIFLKPPQSTEYPSVTLNPNTITTGAFTF